MDKAVDLLQSAYDVLFSVFPSDLGVFLVSLLGIITALALWRIVWGG